MRQCCEVSQLPSTSLVCDVPAKDTCVVSAHGPGTLDLLLSTVRPVYKPLNLLLTNDIWASVSNKVAVLNEGLLPTVIHHIRNVVSA